MIESIKIKKELREEEFIRISHQFKKSIEKQTDARYLSKSFQGFIKQVTPAKEVQLLLPSKLKKALKTVTLEKNIMIDISSSNSMLAKCYQTKEPLFSNDIELDSDYNKDIDNFLDYPLKNLLLLPLLNADREIEGIIWAGILKEDWSQYTQCDLEYMSQVSVLNENITTEEDEEEHQEKNKEESKQDSAPNALKKIKSWLMS